MTEKDYENKRSAEESVKAEWVKENLEPIKKELRFIHESPILKTRSLINPLPIYLDESWLEQNNRRKQREANLDQMIIFGEDGEFMASDENPGGDTMIFETIVDVNPPDAAKLIHERDFGEGSYETLHDETPDDAA